MRYELSSRPVAPQIRGLKTELEFAKFVSDATNGGRHVADEFMRVGKSKWIARALQEGWSEVLRNLVAQLARKDMLEYGDLPSIERLNQLVISKDDHARFKALGTRNA